MKRLEAASIPPAVREALQRLEGAGHEAFVVGGVVRDLLLDRDLVEADWDLATRASPQEVQGLFARVIPTGIAHGTVTVLIEEQPLEVTTYRGETGYSDGRRPDGVMFLDRIEDDLARRDFTVNAMAWNPLHGDLRDPHDGRGDLQRRLLRAVGEAGRRFAEDGLRALRAVRFAAVLDFELEATTLAAIPETLEVYGRVAVERLASELGKLLRGARVDRGLALLLETGLWSRLVPGSEEGVRALFQGREQLARLPSTELIRWAAFLLPATPELASATLDGLRLSRALQQRVTLLLAVHALGLPEAEDAAGLRRRLAALEGGGGAADAQHLQEALCTLWEVQGGGLASAAALRQEAARNPPLTLGALAISGTEVMAILGKRGGPAVGEALRSLLEWVIEDPERNVCDRLQERVRRWDAESSSTSKSR